MGRAPLHEPRSAGPAGLPLPDPKKTLKAYLTGTQMASPMGGVLEVLRVQPLDDGSAKVLLECNTSSLRYELPIKKATRTEKAKVKQILDEGGDPTCPRHGDGQRLVRAGSHLVCMSCGIPFRKGL